MMEEDLQETEEPRGRGMALVRWLLWLPMLAGSACLLVFYLIQPALPPPEGRGQFSPHGIPITGGDPLIPPTLTPAPAGETTATPVPPAAGAAFSYRDEAIARIERCTDAFHAFFLLEQSAFHNPGMVSSEPYQDEAALAAETFREICLPLGQMPAVPADYRDVDRWLKLAAGEVDPAAQTFSRALANDADAIASMDRSMDHMIRFMEYTNRAQDLMRRIDRRKRA